MRFWTLALVLLCCLPAAGQQVQNVPLTIVPRGVAFYPTGNQIVVTSQFGNSVTVLDAGTLAVRSTVASVSSPAGVAVDDSLGLAIVASSRPTRRRSSI